MWAPGIDTPPSQRAWLQSNVNTLSIHLRDCHNAPEAIRLRAQGYLPGESQAASHQVPGPLTPDPSVLDPRLALPPLHIEQHTPHLPAPGPSTLLVPPQIPLRPIDLQVDTRDLSHPPSTSATPLLLSPLQQLPFGPSTSQLSSTSSTPSSLPSVPSQSIALPSVPLKRQRSGNSRSLRRVTSLLKDGLPVWSEEKQRSFEECIAKLTVSANLPFRWVENPHFERLRALGFPGARPISRKILVSRLIPHLVGVYRADANIRMKGGDATASCDGWTAESKHHYHAFMATVRHEVRSQPGFCLLHLFISLGLSCPSDR